MKRPLLLFALIAIAQLGIPGWMVLRHERVVRSGVTYLFRTAPVDPRDPFRGEYVILEFAAESGPFQLPAGWQGGPLHAILNTDEEGFARIEALTAEPPGERNHVIVTLAKWGVDHELGTADRVALPFDRYYVQEGHGPRTEALMRELPADTAWIQGDPTLPTHAVVRVHQGQAVVVDLVIGGRSLRDWMAEPGP